MSGATSKGRSQPSTSGTDRVPGDGAAVGDDKDELAWVGVSTGDDDVIIATSQGKIARFHETDVRPMGRDAAGV